MVGFFIQRPIFASAIAAIMVLAGAICLFSLPVSQFPEITPPQVVVQANYPGASAQVVADTVTTPNEVWRKMLDVVLFAAIYGCRHAIPEMARTGGGSIINTSSGAASTPTASHIAYGSAKGALETFTAYTAAMYGQDGIRCNAIAPGFVATPKALDLFPLDRIEAMKEGTVAGRLAVADLRLAAGIVLGLWREMALAVVARRTPSDIIGTGCAAMLRAQRLLCGQPTGRLHVRYHSKGHIGPRPGSYRRAASGAAAAICTESAGASCLHRHPWCTYSPRCR